jgi:hypothetical protein
MALFNYLGTAGPKWANDLVYWVQYIGIYFKDVFDAIVGYLKPFMAAMKLAMDSLKLFAEGTAELKKGNIDTALTAYTMGTVGLAGAAITNFAAPTVGMGIAGNIMEGSAAARNQRIAELDKKRAAGTLVPNLFGDIKNAFNSVPELANIGKAFGSVGTKADDIYGRIAKNMQGLPGLPPDLNYGGRPVQPTGPIGGNKSLDTLKEISDNTKKTSDILSLRTQTLGGGELAKLGVTSTELKGGARVNSPGLRTAPTLIEQGLRAFMNEQSRKGDVNKPFRR